MSPAEYLVAVKEYILGDSRIERFAVIRERVSVADAHLRAQVVFADRSQLEFSEYVQRTPNGQLEVVTYSYHWTGQEGHLIRRWDNTPHFPGLPGFPHHVHDGADNSVAPGRALHILEVLSEIFDRI